MSEDRRIPGRASSQVSIYDYPEHLNPFYEDENHKRLRFWKINSSSKGAGQKTGRSNSFSLSGLKDIWAFKSFKLKKKSSTLGVNKTSESPPELRRVYPVPDTYNTVDARSRHTYDIGLGNNFQRSGYRSSLQNVHTTGGGGDSNGFYRNDRYRSTIQNGSQTLATTSPRYVYSGSVTPTPKTRYMTPQSRYGSSQTSINSTNPFDEDDDTISRCESVDGVSLRKRKKRKAPQPPVTSPAISTNQQACTTVEEVSGKEDMADISNLTAEIETFVRTHDNDQEKLRENKEKSPVKKKDKSPPIPPVRTTTTTTTTTVKKETSNNNTIAPSQTIVTIEQVPTQTVVIESHSRPVEVDVHSTSTTSANQKITLNETLQEDTERRIIIERKLGNSRESPENNEDYPERTSQTPDPEPIIETVKIRKVSSVKQLNVNDTVVVEPTSDVATQSPPRIIIRKPTEDWECDEEIRINDDGQHASGEESPKTPISSEVEFILEHNTSQNSSPSNQNRSAEVVEVAVERQATLPLNEPTEKPKVSAKKNFENSSESVSAKSPESVQESILEDVPELKIVESTDDLTSTPTVSQSSDRYKIRFIALKSVSPEPQRRDVELRPHNKQQFEDIEDVDLPPAPPQRRRSVRDIIASINKSQSLLKINQRPNGNAEPKRTYNYETYLPQTIPANGPVKEPLQSQSKSSNGESINRKYTELEESERKMRKMISDMEQSSVDVPVPVIEKFDEFVIDDDKSGDLFKKCVVRRDKNLQSGASQDENRSSMEWNPLPKPRRSRNLTHELENGKI